MAYSSVFIGLLSCIVFGNNLVENAIGPFGPPYPVTAAWFEDRYTSQDWNRTLAEFARVGGDTVLLRAPSIVVMSQQDMQSDPEFQWCRATDGSRRSCYDEIVSDLSVKGIKVEALAKYVYHEDYDEGSMVLCPEYDKKIVSSRIYYRLVLSLEPIDPGNPCNLTEKPALVLLTSFDGIDPHALLLQSAQHHNLSVYFGLPQPMVDYSQNEIYPVPPYFDFVKRVLNDHKTRFSDNTNYALYSTLKGYIFSFEFPLLYVQNNNTKVQKTVTILGKDVHSFNKQFLVMTYVDGNKITDNVSTLPTYIEAFDSIIRTKAVDVISVKDGRGSGIGGYFWNTQTNFSIQSTDAGLYEVLKMMHPNIQTNITFGEVFWTSVQQTFYYLAQTRDKLANEGTSVELWLNIEAYDYLHDDPCLPVDTSGSGIDQMLNRITKSRLDRALTNAGAYVQKVAAVAWDPGFTCTTRKHKSRLWQQVEADMGMPVIANCSFHNSLNRSVVVIGYNLDGLTQGFTVDWPHVDGHRVVNTDVHGYYFELDWGVAHHRISSLMYTQLYDPYDVMQLAPKGYVRVLAQGAFHGCAFTYDFTKGTRRDRSDKTKKHYAYITKPRYRVYGQDIPF